MEQKEADITKLAEKNAIERLIKEEPNVYGRTFREMYARRKFPDGGVKFNQYREEELKKLQQKKESAKELSEVENLKQEINEKTQKIEELTDTLKRLQAEFENYKKRIEKEKIEFVKFATADLITQVLPVLDSFEIALKNTSDKDKFVEGMKIVYAQFYSILETEGLRPIKTDGELFDPYKHEVLMKEASEKPEGMILEEFQKGYMLNDKILRFSKVKISGK